jgi:hypothetical protein
MQWELLRAPGGSSQESQWRGCELHTRRTSAHPVGGFEYLVYPKALQVPATCLLHACTLHPASNRTPRGCLLLQRWAVRVHPKLRHSLTCPLCRLRLLCDWQVYALCSRLRC